MMCVRVHGRGEGGVLQRGWELGLTPWAVMLGEAVLRGRCYSKRITLVGTRITLVGTRTQESWPCTVRCRPGAYRRRPVPMSVADGSHAYGVLQVLKPPAIQYTIAHLWLLCLAVRC